MTSPVDSHSLFGSPERIETRSGSPLWRRIVHTPMRDGTVLVGDLYTAEPGQQERPVLLERTPYGRRIRRSSDGRDRFGREIMPVDIAAHFVADGLHVLRQDSRGRGDSEGEFVKYLPEAEDGFDTVEWVGSQEWCDGRVITTGVSYSAHAQAALAGLGPKHLAGMFLDSGGMPSAYETGVRKGGAFELKQATWAYRHALESPEAEADPLLRSALLDQDLPGWFTAMPWWPGQSPLRAAPKYENYLLEQWRQTDFGPYWQHPSLFARGHYDQFPDVPSVHLCSWYDPYSGAAIENFRTLSQRTESYLILGPWTHGARSDRFAGDVDFGPAAPLDGNLAEDYLQFRSDFFSAWLGEGSSARPPAVRYFLMGGGSGRRGPDGRLDHGGQWCSAEAWPPPGSLRRWFPQPDGTLSSHPVAAEVQVAYPADPARPVPTIGGAITSGEPVMRGGAFDQTPDARTFGATPPWLPLAARADVVSFQTAPLPGELVIAGPVRLQLRFSSSAPDTDITVKLIDVHPGTPDDPNGFAMNVTDTVLRCRYRNGFEQGELLTVDRPETITLTLPDTANRFGAGHRLRIDVSSSNFPRFDVNPNTGADPATARHRQLAVNRLHLGPDSFLEAMEREG